MLGKRKRGIRNVHENTEQLTAGDRSLYIIYKHSKFFIMSMLRDSFFSFLLILILSSPSRGNNRAAGFKDFEMT